MLRVRVKNFQVYSEVELEVDGFTSITGPNNGGKSSIARAIRCAFQNIPAASFVRQGTTQSEVGVDWEGGSFLWGRKAGSAGRPYYQIGTDMIFPGREVPDQVKGMGVRGIEIGGDLVWPQFGRQGESPFLLDRSGPVMAEAVCDPNRADQLNRMVKSLEGDRKTVRSRLAVVVDRIGEDRRRLALLERIDPQPIMDRVDAQERSLLALHATYQVYRELASLWKGVRDRRNTLTPIAQAPFFSLSDLKKLFDRYGDLRRVGARSSHFRTNWDRLSRFRDNPIVQVSGEAVRGLWSRYQSLKTLLERRRTKQHQRDRLSSLSVFATCSPEPLKVLLSRLELLRSLHQKNVLIREKLEDLRKMDRKLQLELDQIQIEKDQALANGVCPFCGSDQI